jgi:hypothetical protein
MPRRYLQADIRTHTTISCRTNFLLPRVQHWSHAALTNGPRSSSKFRTAARRSSMPLLYSTRLVVLSTPFRATRAARNCSRRRTTPMLPPSTGTVPVRAWFFVGRRSSVKSGCRVLGPTPSTCLMLILHVRHSEFLDGIRIRSRMFVHGDSQFTWVQKSDHGSVSSIAPYDYSRS